MKSLLRYIKGFRKGKESHRIELEAMKDPFLSDALDGYDAVEDNHLQRIYRIQKQIKNHDTYKKNEIIVTKKGPKQKPLKPTIVIPWKKLRIAAGFLLCLSVGGYYLVVNYKSFSEYGSAVMAERHKAAEESIVYEKDTKDSVDIQQDTLTIYMPEPLFPKSDLIASAQMLEDRFNAEEIEILKLEAPQIQVSSAVDLPTASVAAVDLAAAEFAERSPNTNKPAMIAMNESKQVLDEVAVVADNVAKRRSVDAEVAEVVASKEKATKPEPVIGMKAFKNYLKTGVIQPTDSICKDVKGKVRLRFFINSEGNPYNIQITKSLCPTSNAEAIRLLRSGGKWKPGTEAVEVEVSF